MAIDWSTVPDGRSVGHEVIELMRELLPLPRSLTGDGVRETLGVIARTLPLEVIETPSGTRVFDWEVPEEWNVRDAWIEAPDGTRLADFKESTLHVLGYSAPIDSIVDLEELRKHVHVHETDAELVPYRTSYWERRWGFCLSSRTLEAMTPGSYHVMIDATLAPGSLTSGELTIRGSSDDEFLLSTYVCHPALANDNLSGVALLWALARALSVQDLKFSYRLLWSPGTLGPLCWLARNLDRLDLVRHGLALSCVGDSGPLRYKRSRRGDTEIDRAAALVLGSRAESIVTDWVPTGGDERQFCSPGFDLPLGAFSRTPHGHFAEYHSSADDLTLMTAEAIGESFRSVLEIIDVIETNARYENSSPYGEPQLGRRGLYPGVPDGTNIETALLWVLSLSDGEHDLIAIAERSGLRYEVVRRAAVALMDQGLLKRQDDSDGLDRSERNSRT